MKKKKNVLQSLGSCHLNLKTGASKSGWAPSALPPVSFHRLCPVPAAATAQRWLWSTGVVDRVLGQRWGSWPSFRKSRAGRSWRPRLFGGLCGVLGSIPEHSGSPRDQKVGPMAGSQTQASVRSQAGWRHQSGSMSTQGVCRRRRQKPCPTSPSGHLVLMRVLEASFVWIFEVPLPSPMGFRVALVVKNLPTKAGDAGDASSVPGSGRSPGGGNGFPLQYSCLEHPTDRGA